MCRLLHNSRGRGGVLTGDLLRSLTSGCSSSTLDNLAFTERWAVSRRTAFRRGQRAIINIIGGRGRDIHGFSLINCSLHSSFLRLLIGELLVSLGNNLVGLEGLILVSNPYCISFKLSLLVNLVFAQLGHFVLVVIRLFHFSSCVDDASISVSLVLRLTNDEGKLDARGDTQETRLLCLLLYLDLCHRLIRVGAVFASLLLLSRHLFDSELEGESDLLTLVEILLREGRHHGLVHLGGVDLLNLQIDL